MVRSSESSPFPLVGLFHCFVNSWVRGVKISNSDVGIVYFFLILSIFALEDLLLDTNTLWFVVWLWWVKVVSMWNIPPLSLLMCHSWGLFYLIHKKEFKPKTRTKKMVLNYMSFRRGDILRYKDTDLLKINECKNMYHENGKHQKAGRIIIISDRIEFFCIF